MSGARRLAFLGLGNMGGRMCRRLVDAGFGVRGYDPRPGAAAEAGAEPADSIAAAVDAAEVVLLSLPDSSVVAEVVEGEGGLLSCARAGQVVVDLSTSAPATTRRLHDALLERGVELLDAGVSGGAAAAEQGALTVMVGGSEQALDRVRDVLAPIATSVVYMGESGAGHATKLLNNFLNAVALAATAEVMVAGRKAGLDLPKLLDVLNSSSGVNFATQKRFPSIIRGDYLEGGLTGRLMMKDLVLYLEYMRELGVPSLNASGPIASFGLSHQLGYADQISNRVVDALGDLAENVRLYDEPQADEPQSD
ncbi:MAG: NAD(P)-dependent oxidoreductase [Microbispora sp.]|nr:NAD(P)-dependent oxidoreductase [Microbispora sp.]